MLRSTLLCSMVVALLLVSAVTQARAADDENLRRFDAGPLTADDFAAKPADDSSFNAWTEIEFHLKFRYRYEVKGGVWNIALTEVEVWTAIRRDKSWNNQPKNATLLDHEQGHFDLSQAYALQMQIKLLRELKTAAVLKGRGASEKAAARELDQRLNAVLATYIEQSKTRNREYDKVTASGQDIREQALARKAQREALAELHAELEKLTKQWTGE